MPQYMFQRFIDGVRTDKHREIEAIKLQGDIVQRFYVVEIENSQHGKQDRMGAEILQGFGQMRRLPGRTCHHDMFARERE